MPNKIYQAAQNMADLPRHVVPRLAGGPAKCLDLGDRLRVRSANIRSRISTHGAHEGTRTLQHPVLRTLRDAWGETLAHHAVAEYKSVAREALHDADIRELQNERGETVAYWAVSYHKSLLKVVLQNREIYQLPNGRGYPLLEEITTRHTEKTFSLLENPDVDDEAALLIVRGLARYQAIIGEEELQQFLQNARWLEARQEPENLLTELLKSSDADIRKLGMRASRTWSARDKKPATPSRPRAPNR